MTIDQADYHLDLETYPTHGWVRLRNDDHSGSIGMLLDRDRLVKLRDGIDAVIGQLKAA